MASGQGRMSGSKPLRPKRRKAAAAADFTKVVADARTKIAKAKIDAFEARLEAIVTILDDAEPHDVLLVCAQALAHAMPLCCEKHEDEFKAEFLRVLGGCTASERDAVEAEEAAAEAEGHDDAPPRMH
jgi:hypothetical protein